MTSQHFLHLDYLPKGLLDVNYQDVHQILSEPTLIELTGNQPDPLFISVLLHGNEPTGLNAIQLLLKRYANKPLPRSIALFIGNITAAKNNLRRLDDQPDFNRIWPGTELPPSPETELATAIFNLMANRNVFASIDVHNNTGLNPHYACINQLDDEFLNLARLFGRLVVYFKRPKGVQSAAFAKLCPAVTLECGRPDQAHGVQHALDFLDSCLHLTDHPNHPVHSQDIDLFHTVAQVKIAENINFSFNNPAADLLLTNAIETMNFSEIPAGTILGTTGNNTGMPLFAQDELGNNITASYFKVNNHKLQITRATMPAMLTLNEQVIKQDCLCYLMERLPVSARRLNPAMS